MTDISLNTYAGVILETIQDGVMVVDREGRICFANRALGKLTGMSPAELTGRPCLILNCDLCDYAHKPGSGHWCSLFETGGLKMQRCNLHRRDGTVVPVLKNAAILQDASGRVIGAVETLTDLTEIVKKEQQIDAYRRELHADEGFHGILGTSRPMKRVFDLMANAARSDAPVLILGESGTGKEMVSSVIHHLSPRRDKPFIKVNCAALTESLLESELFGHVKGAFTGAFRDREGRFEAASGGTIFLDEIGDIPPSAQVKLLRVLEEKVIERVGDNTPIHLDVRIITATNRDLEEMVREKRFREDLYYRIRVVPIHLPPLRQRREDIPLLIHRFLRRLILKSEGEVRGISGDAMDALLRYDWPGNVRELKSTLEFAVINCHDEQIALGHLPTHILRTDVAALASGDPPMNIHQLIKTQLCRALEATGGNQTQAANLLGVSRVTVWKWIRKYDISL